ncbi:MAG: PilC/PilY family type IV pilus protein, partial [Pseudomonadota bacterium]
VSLDGGKLAPPGGIAVSFATTGTATSGTDYTALSTPVTIAAGANAATITVTPADDVLVEGDETVIATLTGTNNGDVTINTAANAATVVIASDDTATLTIGNLSQREGSGNGTTNFVFPVTLSAAVQGGFTLAYTTNDGTATVADGDYTDNDNSLSFAGTIGEVKNITVVVAADNKSEPDETFTVALGALSAIDPVAAGKISLVGSPATGTIEYDDYEVSIGVDKTLNEGNAGTTNFVFDVSLDRLNKSGGNITAAVSVTGDTATAGSDYVSPPPASVVFANGDTSKTYTVAVNGDTTVERDEVFLVTLTGATPAVGSNSAAVSSASSANVAVGVINNDDVYDITIDDALPAGGVPEGTALTFKVNLSQAVHNDGAGDKVTVAYTTQAGPAPAAASGSDYPSTSGTLTFNPGSIQETITVPTTADDTVELNENLQVFISSPTQLSRGTATISRTTADGIIKNDDLYKLSISNAAASVDEGNPLTFTVTLLQAPLSGQTVSVNYTTTDGTAKAGIDYTAVAGSFTFAAGQSSKTITVNSINDTLVNDGDLSFTVDLSGATTTGTGVTIVTGSGTGTILDNEYDVNATISGGNGTVSPANEVVQKGSNSNTFTFTADAGYCIQNVTRSDTGSVLGGVVPTSPYGTTFPNIQTDPTNIVGTYRRQIQFTVYIEPAGAQADGKWRLIDVDGGAVTIGGDAEGWHASGTSQALPCERTQFKLQFYPLSGWDAPSQNDVIYPIGPADSDMTVTGTYISKSVTLTLAAVGGGGGETFSADPAGSQEAGEGTYTYLRADATSVTVTASTSSAGYYFVGWSPTGDVSDSTASSTTVVMNASKTLTATFAQYGADADGDKYFAGTGPGDDCNDNDKNIYPGAIDYCNDGIDQDCSGADEICGALDTDNDGDGYTENQNDCNDNNAAINPAASEICGNGVDEDCYEGDRACGGEVTCVTASNIPLETQAQAAPPNVLFVLDDSGSMDWSIMTEESGGDFNNSTYMWDLPDDSTGYPVLPSSQRTLWKSQWGEYNRMYYDNTNNYKPWPQWNTAASTEGSPAFDANLDTPRTNPVRDDWTFNLDSTFFTVQATGGAAAVAPTQSISVQRHSSSNGSSTAADAIALVHTVSGDVVIVDNEDGPSAYAEFGDSWNDSGASDRWSGSARYNNTDPATLGTGTRTATWYPNIPVAGNYNVYAWWPSYNNYDKNARFLIKHTNGTATATIGGASNKVNQRDTGGQWRQLGSTSYPFVAQGVVSGNVDVRNSHYFKWVDHNGDKTPSYKTSQAGITAANSEVYLVNLTKTAGVYDYVIYRYLDDGDDKVENNELSLVGSYTSPGTGDTYWNAIVPRKPLDEGGAVRTATEERQNFANWFSFYSRRELTAKAAIGRTIAGVSGMYIGISGINGHIREKVVPINVAVGGVNQDQTAYLLNKLYQVNSSGGTPLRLGLQDAGQYYDAGDGNSGNLSTTAPWYSEADGGGCQRAFTILMTDGYYNGGTPSPSVGNADSDGTIPFSGTPAKVSVYDKGQFAGPGDNTLADVAMYYYEKDLSTGLTDNVPANKFDIAPHQHMVTYGVSFGVKGTIDPKLWPNCLPSTAPGEATISCPSWPSPDSEDKKIDDLYHAAVNGRGRYLSATNPGALVAALKEIIDEVADSKGTGSSVSINAQELKEGTLLFQASYLTGSWRGDLVAKKLNATTGAVETTEWSAAKKLAEKDYDERYIITYNGTSGARFFNDGTTNELSTRQINLLLDRSAADTSALTAAQQTEIVKLIAYLRGDGTNEGSIAGTYRTRARLDGPDAIGPIGDLVHSAPTHVGSVVYVGANDGMLHAFDAATGEELWAYIPNLVMADLDVLADQTYPHNYYVDNSPYAANVVNLSNQNRTLLVSTLGKGGKGVFALDITDPRPGSESLAASIPQWEYPRQIMPGTETAFVDNDLGYGFSRAFVVNSRLGWVVIMGNGYESVTGRAMLYVFDAFTGDRLAKIDTGVGGASPNCNGLSTPVLIDPDADGKVDYVYAGDLLGNLWKFDLTGTTIADWKVAYKNASNTPQPLFQAKNEQGWRQPITTKPDVMRHPVSGLGGYMVIFGTGRYVGNADFGDSSVQSFYGIWDWAGEWSAKSQDPKELYFGYFKPALTGADQFGLLGYTGKNTDDFIVGAVVNGDSGARGTIVSVEEVSATDGTLTIKNITGTGTFINGDPLTSGTTTAAADGAVAIVKFRPLSNLTEAAVGQNVTLLRQNQIAYVNKMRFMSDNTISWYRPGSAVPAGAIRHIGWYFDLPAASERTIRDPLIRDGKAFMISSIPSDSPCSSGGTSVIHALDAGTGGRSASAVFDISGPEGVPDGVIDEHDLVNIGTAEHPRYVAPTGLERQSMWYTPAVLPVKDSDVDIMYFSTSDGDVKLEKVEAEQTGMFYWREID